CTSRGYNRRNTCACRNTTSMDLRSPHLPRQPFPPVHTHLYRERKPCLYPRIYKSKLSMYPLVIQKQALPDARYQLQLARLPVAIDLTRLTINYTTQHKYQP